jgi:hypothetical protein
MSRFFRSSGWMDDNFLQPPAAHAASAICRRCRKQSQPGLEKRLEHRTAAFVGHALALTSSALLTRQGAVLPPQQQAAVHEEGCHFGNI